MNEFEKGLVEAVKSLPTDKTIRLTPTWDGKDLTITLRYYNRPNLHSYFHNKDTGVYCTFPWETIHTLLFWNNNEVAIDFHRVAKEFDGRLHILEE